MHSNNAVRSSLCLASLATSIEEARSEVMSSLAAASEESYSRAYPFVLKLHALREIEQGVVTALRERDPAKRHEALFQPWASRLRMVHPSLNESREPILALRRSIARILGLRDMEADTWLDLARAARAIGNIPQATQALLHAADLGSDIASIHQAKLLYAQGQVHRAILELEPIERDLEAVVKAHTERYEAAANDRANNHAHFEAVERQKKLEAKKVLYATNWMVESRLLGEAAVIERYSKVIKLNENWEKGHFYLAKFYDSTFKAMIREDPLPVALLTTQREQLAASRWVARRDELVIKAVEHYNLSLQLGTSKVFHSMPRMLTLFFDYGSAVWLSRVYPPATNASTSESQTRSGMNYPHTEPFLNMAKILHGSMHRIPSSTWLCALPQMASRVCHRHEVARDFILKSIASTLLTYPGQIMWTVMGLIKSELKFRKKSGEDILRFALKPFSVPGSRGTVATPAGTVVQIDSFQRLADLMRQLFDGLIRTATEVPPTNPAEPHSRAYTVNVMDNRLFSAYPIILPLQSSLVPKLLPPAGAVQDSLASLGATSSTLGPSGGYGSTARGSLVGGHLVSFPPPATSGLGYGFFGGDGSFYSTSSPSSFSSPAGGGASVNASYSYSYKAFAGAGSGSNGEAPRIVKFDRKGEFMHSKEKPKKLTVLASDGRQYFFLCKQEKRGDLRKDQRMMEFGLLINRLFAKDAEARRRALRLRTFAVVTLKEDCGLLQWVPDTTAFRNEVTRAYASSGLLNPMALTKNVRKRFEELQLQETSDSKRAQLYRKEILLPSFPAVFHKWFLSAFADPTAWFEARLIFTRSSAAWSMVGHIVGLGDRHGENILLDQTTGEAVHVDFDCLFDKGLLLGRPEIVPFRLTPNMCDGFGISGYEGVFRRVSEVCMTVMRGGGGGGGGGSSSGSGSSSSSSSGGGSGSNSNNRDMLVSVLESFIHDPLVEWTPRGALPNPNQVAPPSAPAAGSGAGSGKSPLTAQQQAEKELMSTAAGAEKENRDGLKMIKKISERLDGYYNVGVEAVVTNKSMAWKSSRQAAAASGGSSAAAARRLASSGLSIPGQVSRLLKEATDDQNLSLMYIGWMPWL